MARYGPFALDFGAIMQVGAARGVDLDLLSQALPYVEAAIISNLTDQAPSDQEGGDGRS